MNQIVKQSALNMLSGYTVVDCAGLLSRNRLTSLANLYEAVEAYLSVNCLFYRATDAKEN